MDGLLRDLDTDTAPFSIGENIYLADRPQHGSVTVTDITPYPDGNGWCVTASRDGCVTIAPTHHFRRCPEGWTEPPVLPMRRVDYAMRSDEIEVDASRFDQWRDAMDAWKREMRV